jgi:hypothetical protein
MNRWVGSPRDACAATGSAARQNPNTPGMHAA